MPTSNDQDYFAHRALTERHRARTAPTQVIAEIHRDLARRYEELAREEEQPIVRMAFHQKDRSAAN